MYLRIFCSLDSLIATSGMAFAGCPKAYQSRVILGFMMSDMLAGIAGASMSARVPAAALIAALAAAVLALACAQRWPVLYLAAPILLSVDNLAMGAADVQVSFRSAALDGAWSAALAYAGFAFARRAMSASRRLRDAELPG
jgi:hypothetical protein